MLVNTRGREVEGQMLYREREGTDCKGDGRGENGYSSVCSKDRGRLAGTADIVEGEEIVRKTPPQKWRQIFVSTGRHN